MNSIEAAIRLLRERRDQAEVEKERIRQRLNEMAPTAATYRHTLNEFDYTIGKIDGLKTALQLLQEDPFDEHGKRPDDPLGDQQRFRDPSGRTIRD